MVSEDKPTFRQFTAPVTPAEEPRQHWEARLRLSASTTIRGDVQGFTRWTIPARTHTYRFLKWTYVGKPLTA
jgi:hypothetical protein